MKNNRRKKIRPIYVSFLATLLTAAFLLNWSICCIFPTVQEN